MPSTTATWTFGIRAAGERGGHMEALVCVELITIAAPNHAVFRRKPLHNKNPRLPGASGLNCG